MFELELPYSDSFSNVSLPNKGRFANFVQNQLLWQRPRGIRKRDPCRSSGMKYLSLVKNCENRSSGSGDNWSEKERKKLWKVKHTALFGKFAKWAKQIKPTELEP